MDIVSLHDLSKTYNLLADSYSRDIFTQVVALRVIFAKLSLPVESHPSLPILYKLREQFEHAPIILQNKKYYTFDLTDYGYDIVLTCDNAYGAYIDYILRQYEYNHGGVVIKATENNVVLDGGGYIGDTALYFAHETASHGKVYSFEFLQKNTQIMRHNLAANPKYAKQINIVNHALWSKTGEELFVTDDAAASHVSKTEQPGKKVTSLSIDDFVDQYRLESVDFIKLDIEGAEPEALRGAVKTLNRFRPKLAICLYHDLRHFHSVPALLNGLDLGYSFFVDHFTPHLGETVLFAQPE